MPESRELKVTFVPGVTPGKWIHRWEERMPQVKLLAVPATESGQLDAVRAGTADMAFVRLPVEKDGLNVIPLYTELSVVVAPKDHPIAAFEEIDVAELADEYLLAHPEDFPQWRDVSSEIREGTRKPLPKMRSVEEALDLVEAGLGILILPMSVARHFNRKELRARILTGVDESGIGLAWLRADKPLADDFETVIEEFIGVVRGRSANSSRQPSVLAKQAEAPKKGSSTSRTSTNGKGGGKGGAGKGAAKSGLHLRGGGRPGGKARAQKRGRR
ncbi:LysR family transcriptional regulator substrate-binding protein [Arthrobacter cryoconiti]|uniref:LysR family transcriptional regulator substrate-binding protein n=1 Tax=Arthrobacter cryoconiti TaxID=748907 RepID=A0ABV8QZV2_9MICC|nr:LysR family transcriptional regulator substrate-binding protein [Arthrobacter cryoconiti]MCC9067366.1 LysR family transcriptional regulator substrate-binding protein [Arthrobacter cryoconiti]